MNAVQQDESELVRKSAAADKSAFAELVAQHRSYVVALAYRLSGDTALAEDIAQDVFVRVWQALPGFRAQSTFRTWLYRMTSNTAVDQLRRARPTTDVGKLPLSTTGSLEGQAMRDEQRQVVQKAILRLPLNVRLALILQEYEGLSYQEAASVLAIPIGTVMSRLNYARERLRQDLAWYIQSCSGGEQ